MQKLRYISHNSNSSRYKKDEMVRILRFSMIQGPPTMSNTESVIYLGSWIRRNSGNLICRPLLQQEILLIHTCDKLLSEIKYEFSSHSFQTFFFLAERLDSKTEDAVVDNCVFKLQLIDKFGEEV